MLPENGDFFILWQHVARSWQQATFQHTLGSIVGQHVAPTMLPEMLPSVCPALEGCPQFRGLD